MFSLGAKQAPPIVRQIPYIPKLEENNVREGFFEHEEYEKLHDFLPPHLKPVAELAYKTGMRKSEILNLTWDQVDLNKNLLRFRDKTKKLRTVPLSGSLLILFRWQKKIKEASGSTVEYVFTNADRTDRIKDFRGAWTSACDKAELGKRHFHDFRRTAVRNMVRAGVPEKIAMEISGHKTRSIFDRYNIVDEKDLKTAMDKTEAYIKRNDKTQLRVVKK
jgi:integrase